MQKSTLATAGIQSCSDLRELVLNGQSVAVQAVPGSGKTTLAADLASALLSAEHSTDFWSPVLLLTADRRRATMTDRLVGDLLRQQIGDDHAHLQVGADGPGSHRLVRTVGSYAHLITGMWCVEREQPIPKLPFVSGGNEDARIQDYLASNPGLWQSIYPEQTQLSAAVRMEIRNLLARAGESGLLPEDLDWLATRFDRPLWHLAAGIFMELAGHGAVAYSMETPGADSARMPRIAANLLNQWDRDGSGVAAALPVPRVLIVDDIQDMPTSAAALISAVASKAEQVVLFSSPSSASAAFRGGTPELMDGIAADLGLPVVEVSANIRSTFEVVRTAAAITSWLPDGGSMTGGNEQGLVTAELASSDTRRDALISEHLRRHHVMEGISWDRMAVIARRADQIDPLRRRLARAGIPLTLADRPVELARVPLCAALLHLLADAPDATEFDAEPLDREPLVQQAMGLLTSGLVSADPLAVFRLIRDVRSRSDIQSIDELDLLEMPDEGIWVSPPRSRADREMRERLTRARALWRQREQAASQSPQMGLWLLWNATGLSESLREVALKREKSGRLSQSVEAADNLDSMMALFRKADLWQQQAMQEERAEAASARAFAVQLLHESVESDSLAVGGVPQPGVTVTTPAGAAGLEWDVVCVVGPQMGEWPGGSAHFDSVALLSRLLGDARRRGWTPEQPIDGFLPDRGVGFSLSAATLGQQQRVDDARLFLLAATRARYGLHFVVVESEQQAPSTFLLQLADDGVLPSLFDAEDRPIYSATTVQSGLEDLVGTLRRAVVDADSTEQQRSDAALILALLASEGVRAAEPNSWNAIGTLSSTTPINEIGQVRLSPSRIDTALKCPLNWFLTSVHADDQQIATDLDGLDPRALGILIHSIAEELPHGTREEMLSLLEEKWAEIGPVTETYWTRKSWDDAVLMVQRLAAHTSSFQGEVISEVSLGYDLGDARVSGRADRIEISSDGSARIVDIKTGAPIAAKAAEQSGQLTAYQLGLAEMGYTSAGAALLQLKSAGAPGFAEQSALTAESLEAKREEFEQLADSLSSAQFEAHADRGLCTNCRFVSVCPAKQQSLRTRP